MSFHRDVIDYTSLHLSAHIIPFFVAVGYLILLLLTKKNEESRPIINSTRNDTKHFGMKLNPNDNNINHHTHNDTISLSSSSFSSSGHYNIYPPPTMMTKEESNEKQFQQQQNNQNLSFIQRIKTSVKILKEIIPKHGLDIHGRGVSTSNDNSNCNDNRSRDNNRNKNHLNDEDDYYEDKFNDLSWNCSFGKTEHDGIWMNTSDVSGTIMASMVWIMICKYRKKKNLHFILFFVKIIQLKMLYI